MKRWNPTFNRILVHKILQPAKTETGILLPEKSTKLNSGKVIAVGPGSRDRDGKLLPVSVKEGDTVLLTSFRILHLSPQTIDLTKNTHLKKNVNAYGFHLNQYSAYTKNSQSQFQQSPKFLIHRKQPQDIEISKFVLGMDPSKKLCVRMMDASIIFSRTKTSSVHCTSNENASGFVFLRRIIVFFFDKEKNNCFSD